MNLVDNYKIMLAENIEKLLKSKKMKKQDLASKTGISVSFISDITNLKANPSIQNLAKIAEVLSVPLPLLFVPLNTIWAEAEVDGSPDSVYVFTKITKQQAFLMKKNIGAT